MPKARQLTVQVPDRPRALAEVACALWERGVNIEAFQAAEGKGAIRFIVDKPATAKTALARRGWKVTEEEVVVLTLADKPGSLSAAASKLGKAGVNIKYAYMGTTERAGKAKTYLGVDDLPRALTALRPSR